MRSKSQLLALAFSWVTLSLWGRSSIADQIASEPPLAVVLVALAPPVIQAPPDITVCFGAGTNPSVTGLPTIISSCSPADQVQLVFTDSLPINGTRIRTWKAVDLLCGTSLGKTQRITVLGGPDNPTISVDTERDGLLLTVHAEGTKGVITQANWFINNTPVIEGNGLHFIDLVTVQVDLSVFDFSQGLSFSVEVQTLFQGCLLSGGIGIDLQPQVTIYTLSRGVSILPPTSPASNDTVPPVLCGNVLTSYSSATSLLLFTANDPGIAVVRSDLASARLVALSAGALLQPVALDCGVGQVQFSVEKSKRYVIGVDATGSFSLISQVLEPKPGILIRGYLGFGAVRLNAVVSTTLAIENSGNAPLNVVDITLPTGFTADWKNGQISPGLFQPVTITFSPQALGDYSGSVNITSDAGPLSVPISGTGIAPAIALNGNLAFGNVQLNSSAFATLTITNPGSATLNVSGITLPDSFTADWTSGAIPEAGSQPVKITFVPKDTIAYGGILSVKSDAFSGASTMVISGNGVAGTISLGGNLVFSGVPVGSSKTGTLIISNTGQGNLTVNKITYPYPSPIFTGDWSGGIISPHGSMTIHVTFKPAAAITYSGNTIVDSDAKGGNGLFAVSANAVEAIIHVAGNLSFGQVPLNTSKTLSATISNAGNATLQVSGFDLPGNVFTLDWAGGPIAPAASREVHVTFKPTAAISYAGLLAVKSDATSGDSTLPISGTGFSVGFFGSLLHKPENGVFQLSFSTITGKTVVLEGSDNLVSWTQIQTFQATSTALAYSDPVPPAARRHFYRFRLLP